MAKPRNNWYRFENAANGKPAKLTIEGELGEWATSSKDFRESFARLGETEPVALHIVSGGGSIFTGQEIANIIRGHKGEVTATLGSIVASIATVVACAAKTATASKNTIYMIHRASAFAGGNADEMRKTAEIMEKLESGIVAAYVDKTGMDKDELAEMMDEETWMDAEEAKALGFIDAIDEEDADDEIVDTVNLRHYKNSATLLSRLHIEAPESFGANAGNGRRLTLQAIRNAAKPPALPTPVPKSPTMTTEELAAQKTEIEKLAKAQALEMVKAKNSRDKEIRDAVALIAKRDKKDFTALADEYINDGEKTVDQFFRAVHTSDKFKTTEVVGSGIEVIESMDQYKGTPGFQFVNSAHGQEFFQNWRQRGRHNFSLTLAVPSSFLNATQTSASPHQLTSIEYKPGVAPLGLRALRVKQIIPGGATNATTIRGRREDAFTDDAGSVTETGALPLLAVSVLEVDYPVKDLGGYIEVSENLMADYEAVMSLINQRVPYKVERVTDYQLLSGAGAGADLTGILNTSGIQTQAKGGDTAVDAIFKAKTNVETVPNGVQANAGGGYAPDFIVVNPTDWQNVRLLKDNNLQYYGGGPFTGAYGVGAGFSNVDMLWGIPCVRTTAIAAGTALVGAFAECAQWFQRQGLVIEMTNSNGTNFINRIVTIRAAERIALTVDQPNGFCQVTGL